MTEIITEFTSVAEPRFIERPRIDQYWRDKLGVKAN